MGTETSDRYRLPVERLRWRCSPAGFDFETTAEMTDCPINIIGQPRAQEALERLMMENGDSAAIQYAEIHAYRGDVDLAFDWLERARTSRRRAVYQSRVNPLLRNLHGDPRWEEFLREMGLDG